MSWIRDVGSRVCQGVEMSGSRVCQGVEYVRD